MIKLRSNPALTLTKESVDNPVFSGGGAMAFAQLGAMLALKEAGVLTEKPDNKTIGTSAGAMMATLWAFGYRSYDQLAPLTVQQHFDVFTDVGIREAVEILPNALLRRGIFDGKELELWVQHALARRTGHPQMNFAEMQEWRQQAQLPLQEALPFFEKKFAQAQKDFAKFHHLYKSYSNNGAFDYDFESPQQLYEIAKEFTDLTVCASEIIGKERNYERQKAKGDNPDPIFRPIHFCGANQQYCQTPIAKAVAASANFPYVFTKRKVNGVWMLDGGLVDNIGIEVTDKEGEPPNARTLAVVVRPRESQDLLAEKSSKRRKLEKIARIFNWPIDITESIFKESMQKELSVPADNARMLVLEVDDVGVTDFHIDSYTKLSMIEEAYNETRLKLQENAIVIPAFSSVNPLARQAVEQADFQQSRLLPDYTANWQEYIAQRELLGAEMPTSTLSVRARE